MAAAAEWLRLAPGAARQGRGDPRRFLDYPTTLRSIARLALPMLADWCVVDLLEDGRPQRVAACHRDELMEPLVLRLAQYAFAHPELSFAVPLNPSTNGMRRGDPSEPH